MTRLPVLLLAATVAASCAEGSDAGWSGTIEERDGAVWVMNPAPADDPAEAVPPFRLELEQRFGVEEEPEEEILEFIRGLTVDDAGNVYVVDVGNRIVAFGPDGARLWTAGREGDGPGEFRDPGKIAWDGAGHLYVDNQNGAQVQIWTTGGEYVDTQLLAGFDISQGFVVDLPDPSTLVLWSWSRTHGDGVVLHVFDIGGPEWVRTAQFFGLGGRLADSDEPGDWGHANVQPGDGTVWVGNRIRYELREYALDGSVRRVIAGDYPELIPTFSYRGTGFGLGGFSAPLWLPDGHGLVPRHRLVGFDNAEKIRRAWDQYLASRDRADDIRSYTSAIDLIDREGRIIGTMPMEGAFWAGPMGDPVAAGPDGAIYTQVYEPYPHVRRYRVEIR